MVHKNLYPLVLAIGIIFGFCASYIDFYDDSNQYSNIELLEEIFKHSNSEILDSNNSCHGNQLKNVGNVVASLLSMNTINKANMLVYGCYDDTCSMSLTECPPWQENECSSRFLKFNLDISNKIRPETFMCIDIP